MCNMHVQNVDGVELKKRRNPKDFPDIRLGHVKTQVVNIVCSPQAVCLGKGQVESAVLYNAFGYIVFIFSCCTIENICQMLSYFFIAPALNGFHAQRLS